MLSKIIIILCIALSYLMIGALATTNILRLTRGNDLPVLSSACRCASCGGRITVLMQMPIVSYIALRGRCGYCGAPIPKQGLFLEILISSGMLLLTALFGFSFWGVTAAFLFYEAVRAAFVLKFGKRERDFARQYVIAVAAMIPCWALLQFMAALYLAV